MNQIERVREEIARRAHALDVLSGGCMWDWDNARHDRYYEFADSILVIPGLEIRYSDQTPPENPIGSRFLDSRYLDKLIYDTTAETQQDMIKAGWVKVMPHV